MTIRLLASDNSPIENLKFGLGGRDSPPPLPVMGARADRALGNLQEALFVFLPLAILAEMQGPAQPVAIYGAMFFFCMRVLYVPAYLSAIPGLRSACWMAGWVGLLAIGSTLL